MGFFVSEKKGQLSLKEGHFEGYFKVFCKFWKKPISGTLTLNGSNGNTLPPVMRNKPGSVFKGDFIDYGYKMDGTFECKTNNYRLTLEGIWKRNCYSLWEFQFRYLFITFANGYEFQGKKKKSSYLCGKYVTNQGIYDGSWDVSLTYIHDFCKLLMENPKLKFSGDIHNIKSNNTGVWKYGRPWQGFMRYKDYVGSYERGKKHGQGTLVMDHDRVYKGMFRENSMCGLGTLQDNKHNTEYKGEFKDGKYHGHGILTTTTNVFEGHFQNNQKHGQGTLYDLNGNVLQSGIYKFDTFYRASGQNKNGYGDEFANVNQYFQQQQQTSDEGQPSAPPKPS